MIEINGEKYVPQYLFEADYNDGQSYIQGSDDKSIQEEGKNAFYDIFYKPYKPLADLIKFHIVGQGHRYTVSMIDGHFEIDGLAFQAYEFPLKEYRLIFYKTHRHHFTPAGKTVGHEIDFVIGWQGNDAKGKNVQRIIIIK